LEYISGIYNYLIAVTPGTSDLNPLEESRVLLMYPERDGPPAVSRVESVNGAGETLAGAFAPGFQWKEHVSGPVVERHGTA